MNILVTGAAGFLGSHLVRHLGAEGEHVVHGLEHDVRRCGYLRGDVTDYARMLEIIVDREIDQIYHCAAKSVVRNCRLDPIGCFETNVLGTVTLLEAARQSERVQGIMVMESDKSYGPGPVPYREDQALVPEGVYEASKACVSHVVRAYHKNYGLPVFSVRSANVYGPGDPNMSRLIPNTITRLLRGEQPQLTEGAEEFKREFIYVDDWRRLVVQLMAAGPWGEAINVGTGVTYALRHVVDIICDLMRCSRSVLLWPKPDTLLEIPKQQLCLDKCFATLGGEHLIINLGSVEMCSTRSCFSGMLTLQTGLAKTIRWYDDIGE